MAQETLAEHLSRKQNTNQAKNAILFMGDGLSLPTLTATRIFQGGEQSKMVFDQFPHVGLSKVIYNLH
jgi:alkaline phosphatase